MNKNTFHILVVDDDDRIRELVKEYLIESNFLVTTAIDALDAKKKLEKTIFCSKKGVQKGVQSRWIPIRKSQFVKVFFQYPDLTSEKLSRRI